MCYNSTVKKILAVTTSLCAAVCALSFGGAAAFAETGGGADAAPSGSQYYPATFETVPEFTDLKDYAVGNGKFLFLENNKISEYGNESVTAYEGNGKPIIHLYFKGEEFYYETDDGKYYALKNFNTDNPEEDFTYTQFDDILLPNKHNYFINNGEYYFLDKNNPLQAAVLLEGFSNLKRYNDTVYAVKENVLYTLNGTDETAVTVENFEITKNITVGNALKKLAQSADGDPVFVSLSKDAYMTEVDLDSVTEHTVCFSTGDTVKINTGETPTALLLYKAGNNEEGIAVIAVNGKTYLTHPKAVTEKTVHPFKDSEFTEGTATEGFIYSAPCISKGTQIKKLPYGTKVTILKEIKREDNPELDHDYYYVEYKADEETTVKGYVRFGLL